MLWSARRNPTRHLEPRERLKELYKESRGGAPDGPIRKELGRYGLLCRPYGQTRQPEG